MKDSIKNRKKKLLALCLSALMLSSVTAFAACKDGNAADSSSTTSSSSASTSEEKDTGLIKNAGFETFNEKNAINTSATGTGSFLDRCRFHRSGGRHGDR